MFQAESVLSSIIRSFDSETVQTEEGATVFLKAYQTISLLIFQFVGDLCSQQ